MSELIAQPAIERRAVAGRRPLAELAAARLAVLDLPMVGLALLAGALYLVNLTVSGYARGDLTIHDVTKRVEIPVQATRSGDVITVTGSIDIVFADYGVTPPTSFIAVSVEDHGIIEFQLHFSHA